MKNSNLMNPIILYVLSDNNRRRIRLKCIERDCRRTELCPHSNALNTRTDARSAEMPLEAVNAGRTTR